MVYDWVIHWIDDFLSSSLCGYLFVGAIIFAGLELAVQVVQSSSGGDGSAALPSDVGIIGMLGYEADNMFEWGEKHPVALLSLNFGIAFAVGTFVLFLKDMTDWWEARQIAAQDEKRRKTGYKRLSEAEEGGKVEGSKLSPEKLAKELRRNTDHVEELEVKVKVYNTSKATSEQAIDARNRLKILKARGDELRSILHGGSSEKEETKKKISSGQTGLVNVVLGSALCQIMARSGNGLLVVGLYFADVYSDMKVIALLYTTGNYLWCAMSASILIVQFGVVYLRVLPYLRSTFGRDHPVYLLFMIFGFPLGLFVFDILMFLEPFGLLTVLPIPDWLRQFVPAYKATRVITEVLVESLPQCLLQACIYIIILHNEETGTITYSQSLMLPFISALPVSIIVSTLASEMTWIELVRSARQAGLTVIAKGIQLWNVGAGLPLDALKKGAIVEWTCSYELDPSEVLPLIDALIQNSSLTHLDLSESGLKFGHDCIGSAESGALMVEAMARSQATLSSLREIVVSKQSRYIIPVEALRGGRDKAMATMQKQRFMSSGGPWREEIFLMGDLMRRVVEGAHGPESSVESHKAGDEIAKILSEGRKGRLSKYEWEKSIKQLISDGWMRRGHLASLVCAEALRDVGFKVVELTSTAFSLLELRQGGFTATEMKEATHVAAELGEVGFTAAELRKGGYTAAQLKSSKYFSLEDLKHGGFTVKQLKGIGYQASQLRESGFTPNELRQGSFVAKDLKPLGYTVEELRQAEFSAQDLRNVHF